VNVSEYVGGDPGKGVLLLLVDQYGRVLRYTARQRRHETQGRNTGAKREANRPRGTVTIHGRDNLVQPLFTWERVSASQLHSEMRRRNLSSRTCDLTCLREYMALREMSRPVFHKSVHKHGVPKLKVHCMDET